MPKTPNPWQTPRVIFNLAAYRGMQRGINQLADAIRPTLGPLAKLVPRPVGPAVRPFLDLVPADTYAWTLWPSVALLPRRVREEYGFAWGPLQATVSGWLVAGWQAWRPLIPTGWRWMPQARAADRRVAGQ